MSPISEDANPAARGSARILVVEDFGPVRTLLIRVLAAEGYDVVGVARASDAVERCRAGRFDLVITETEVPGGTGDDIALRALEVNPQLAVIFMSGWPGFVHDLEIDEGRVGIVVKPIDIDELTRRVRQVLALPSA